jgi:DNA-directed RNA polymerase subunit RPC12/RpoP
VETRSDSQRWFIEFQCPRCGAAVSLEETERIFTCAYCRVKLCLGSPGPLQYCIPPSSATGDPVLFAPYWRLKGMVFTCMPGTIKAGTVDFSHIALHSNTLPWSLGIRPQLARLHFLDPGVMGTFLSPSLTIEQAVSGYETNMTRLGVSPWADKALHRAFIGEQTSLLYYPLTRRGGQIVDALQDRIFESAAEWEARAPAERQPDFRVRFYAATCPDCGRDLDGDRDTLVLTCRNCDGAWKRGSEGLEEMPVYVVPDKAREERVGLPFWRIRIGVEGVSLSTFGDFARFSNLPRAITPAMEDAAFFFWVPAFKVNAELYLMLIRRMTLFQWRGDFEQRLGGLDCHPVTLPAEEGAESLKTAMADLVADKRTLLPVLGNLEIAMKETLLVYLPFRARGGELIQPQIQLGIQRKALQYGLNI